MPLGNGAKKRTPQEYLFIRQWYPCDGEDRFCEKCFKPALQYSAVYQVKWLSSHIPDPDNLSGVAYWGTCTRCAECERAIWKDENGNFIKETLFKLKLKKEKADE